MARKKKTDEAKEKAVPAETEEQLHKRAIELVLDSKEESLSFYDEKFRLFNYFDRLYIRGSAKSNTPNGRANLELPLAFQQVEPFVSQMSETMVGEAPYIAYTGRTAQDDIAAPEITDYTQYQLETGGFVPAYMQYLRNLAKYGTAIMKLPWEYEIKNVNHTSIQEVPLVDEQGQAIIGLDGQPIMTEQEVTEEKEVVVHDGPKFYNRSIYDFLVPRSATSCNIQIMDWCIDRAWRELDDLLYHPNYELGRKKLLKISKEQDLDDYDSNSSTPPMSGRDTAKEEQQRQNNGKGFEKFAGKYEVLEWWGKFKFKKNEPAKEALIVVAICDSEEDDAILLRFDENPLDYKFRPFIGSNDYPVEGEFYGYGELNHIKGLIQESTALRNARLDVANMSLNRMWIVERQAGINLRDLYSAPNKIILTNDKSGISALDMGQVTASSVNELSRIDYDIQNTTEIINPRQDVSSVGAAFGGTATGVNFLSAKSNLRLLTKARIQEETFFKPLAIMLNEYNKQMVTDKIFYRITDKNENPYSMNNQMQDKEIGPDAFATEVDFKPSSNPSKLTNDEKKANIGYLLQNIIQIEKVLPGTNNFVELLPDIYKISGFPHSERYVNPPQTQVMATPDGQLLDKRGQPVQVIQVDEQGQPVEQQPPMPGQPQ